MIRSGSFTRVTWLIHACHSLKWVFGLTQVGDKTHLHTRLDWRGQWSPVFLCTHTRLDLRVKPLFSMYTHSTRLTRSVKPRFSMLDVQQGFSTFGILCGWFPRLLCVIWLIHVCDMTHSHVRRDSFIRLIYTCGTWISHVTLIYTCDMTDEFSAVVFLGWMFDADVRIFRKRATNHRALLQKL